MKLPKLVLADEPTSGLDSKTAESILELFTSYASDHKTAFIIVSHNPLVKEHVDSIYEIRSRKIVEAQ